MAGDRAKAVRGFARRLSEEYGVEVRARFNSKAEWDLEWGDGPTRTTVRALAATVDLAGAELRLHRSETVRAFAVAAIRLSQADRFRRYASESENYQMVMHHLSSVPDPDQTADEREEAMVLRLLAASAPNGWTNDSEVVRLVAAKGIGWLLTTTATDGEDSTAVAPLELLTDRYATGDARESWERRAELLPLHTAVQSALADPQVGADAALAVTALLGRLREELAATEARALVLAQRTGSSWTQIGAAMGVARQTAHQYAKARDALIPGRAASAGD